MIENFSEFSNIGWKLHIPVEADFDNPLTRDVCDFLNERYNVSVPNGQRAFYVPNNTDGFSLYKVGCGGKSGTGKGMTIYTSTHTQEEAFNLAKELEEKFGSRLAKTGFKMADEYVVTPHVTARFVLDEGNMGNYCSHKGFGQSTGTLMQVKFPRWVRGNPLLENEFRAGYSMLECIDSCGTLITGDLSKGTPKFITEAFGPNFLKEYPYLLQELPQRVQKGDINFAKQLLKRIGEGHILGQEDFAKEKVRLGNLICRNKITSDEYLKLLGDYKSKLGHFVSNLDSIVKLNYVTKLNPNILSEALEQIAKETPEIYNNLQTNLPSILKSYPELQSIRTIIANPNIVKTNPIPQKTMSWVDDAVAKWKANVKTPISTSSVVSLQTPSVHQQVLGLNKPTGYTEIAHVDIDKVFSSLTRGEVQARVVKPTTPVLEDVISAALNKVNKTPVVKSTVPRGQNISKIICTALKYIKI